MGVYGDLIKFHPNPYFIYLRGTIRCGIWGLGLLIGRLPISDARLRDSSIGDSGWRA